MAAPAITTLPTGWRIVGPDGPVATVGTLPEGLALSPDGTRLVEVEAGHQPPALRVFDAASLHELRTVKLNGAFGVPLRDPDGAGVWVNVAGDFQEQIAHVDIATGTIDRDVSLPLPFFPVALARSPDGNLLAVAGDLGGRVAFIDPSAERVVRTVRVGLHPAALAFAPDGSALYVAERGERAVDVVGARPRDPALRGLTGSAAWRMVRETTSTRRARSRGSPASPSACTPTRCARRRTPLRRGRRRRRCRDRRPHAQRMIARVPLPFTARRVGESPNAMTLGRQPTVRAAARPTRSRSSASPERLTPLGAIPPGWYPTAVAVDRANGALSSPTARASAVTPTRVRSADRRERRLHRRQHRRPMRRLPIPERRRARARARHRRSCAPRERSAEPDRACDGPIRHVIYVIKENRTYDEVLGDLAPATVIPRWSCLAGDDAEPARDRRRFGTFDRFFEDAHVSADGHNWSTAAFANDYLEKMWPQEYAGRGRPYDFEDAAKPSVPHAGYLWDDAVAHGITLRNYGEFVTSGAERRRRRSRLRRRARTRTDPRLRDLRPRRRRRRARDGVEARVRRLRARGTLPPLEIVRLPDDHTAGTKPGAHTPQAMVADNDRAVGALVEAISHTRDWTSTAIFMIEDDAQNGPTTSTSSARRSTSPAARGGGVQHTMPARRR